MTPQTTRSLRADGMFWDGSCWRNPKKRAASKGNALRGTFTHPETGEKYRGRPENCPWPVHPVTGNRMAYDSLEKVRKANAGRRTISGGRRVTPSHPEYPGGTTTKPRRHVPGFDAAFDERMKPVMKAAEDTIENTKEGYVYVAQRRDKDNRVKIGFAVRPHDRVGSWNTGLEPSEEYELVQVFGPFAVAREQEKAVHTAFAKYRVGRKEIFRVSAPLATMMISQLV